MTTEVSRSPALPRLAYVGDVPVESSYHGSTLLYRLLQRFPAQDLRIVEVLHESLPGRRLPGVGYCFYRPKLLRALSSRLHDLAEPIAALLAPRMHADLERACLSEFRPEAILTVVHGLGWMMAAALAERLQLPLHLIVHDDWPGFAWREGLVNKVLGSRFARCYKGAASRLCVSPYMVEEYQARYGVRGTVLYPSRAPDAAYFKGPPPPRSGGRPFTVAFAGTLFTADYSLTLCSLAKELEGIGGKLLLFGPFDETQLARMGLGLKNVNCGGLISSDQLVERLRVEADVLFVPMSFANADGEAMRLNFPSKLADYTRTGLPLLIAGPQNSSAVRWAVANPEAAAVVQSNQPASLAAAISRMAGDSMYCHRLAVGAIECGLRYFSHDAAERTLFGQLNAVHRSSAIS